MPADTVGKVSKHYLEAGAGLVEQPLRLNYMLTIDL